MAWRLLTKPCRLLGTTRTFSNGKRQSAACKSTLIFRYINARLNTAVDGGIKGPSMKTTVPGPKTKVNI